MISGKYTIQETNNRIYERVLREYLNRLMKENKNKNMKFQAAIHIMKLLDSLRVDTKFSYVDFDFVGYYQQYAETEENLIRDNALAKAQQLLGSPMV